MYDKLKELLKEINDDDLRAMFNTAYPTSILGNMFKAKEELEKYMEYVLPVSLGDIVLINETKYVVTCVYTDNSVDILDWKLNKKNVGLYNKTVKVIGKLDVIQEG